MKIDVNPHELEWVKKEYPTLKTDEEDFIKISGVFEFDATYKSNNEEENFPRIKDSYEIEIIFLSNNFSTLPQVRNIGGRIQNNINKEEKESFCFHINPNGTFCLCPYPAETEKLPNGFNVKDFFNNLLIPFLYAQSYYERYKKWPWGEYSHGELGLLEYYFEKRGDGGNLELIKKCIEDFKKVGLGKSYTLLKKNDKIKGHMPCICGSGKKIRDCHTVSFKGLWNLKEDIKINNISV